MTAKDKGTGKEQSIKITASSGLTEGEIKKMTVDAAAHSDEDRRKRLLAEKRNEADTLVYTVEKTLKEHGDKISEEDKKKITDALERCKQLKDTADSIDPLQKAIEDLTSASHKLAEHIYKSPPSDAQQESETKPSEEKSQKEEVVEAEFEEPDKDKKE